MRLAVAVSCVLLAGCETIMAPIDDITRPSPPKPAAAKPAVKPPPKAAAMPAPGSTHTVQKGDTLFSIAFANGLDFRELAAWNELPSPDVIRVGQVLRLTPPAPGAPNASGVQTMPVRESELQGKALPEIPTFSTPQAQRLPWSEANWTKLNEAPARATVKAESSPPAEKPPAAEESKPAVATKAEPASTIDAWLWPASGALLGRYGEGGGKGIDLAGDRGTPVVAAAPGKVVYSGSGLRGYGQLVIIKHANDYLSAYAHNQKVLVREGEQVNAGQKIAEMGDTDADRVKLHFEIRQFGKPIDPLRLLPNRS